MDIQRQMTAAQTRLTTGKRVNSATDDPAAFFTASSLHSRAASLVALTGNIANANNTISAATKAITSLQGLLTTAQSVAAQALASAASAATVTGTNTSALAASSTIATTGGNGSRFKAGDTVTVSDGTTTATYTAANNDTVQTFLTAINTTANLKVTASLNSNGQIQLVGTSTNNITVGGVINGAGGGTLSSIVGLTAGTTNFTANVVRSSAATQFDSLRAQFDQIVQDANYNGSNLLTGTSMTVKFNETGTSSYTLTGAVSTATALGLAASTNNFQSDSDINTAITNIKSAIATLQATATSVSTMSKITEARSQFNSDLIDTLEAGANGLTASDTNADSALLLALQTRQQLATTSLSLSHSADAPALRLLGLG